MAKSAKKPRLLSIEDHVALLDGFDSSEQDLKDRLYERIQTRTEFDPLTECVIYTGAWEPRSGQARIRLGTKVYCLTRVTAWIYLPGFRIWSGRRVVRTCDAPACCNPDHIRVLADQAAAMDHQREVGKIGSAPNHLTRRKAEQMRRDHAAGASIEELMAKAGLRRRAVRAVLSCKTWAPKGAA